MGVCLAPSSLIFMLHVPSFRPDGPCSPGYFCPSGSTSPTAVECGGEHNYCPAGSVAASAVVPGTYSTPADGSALNRTGVADCDPGYYCTGGKRIMCPSGTYGSTAKLETSSCSGTQGARANLP